MNNMYNGHISNLISSVTQKLAVVKAGTILIKHYNSIDIKQELIEKVFLNKDEIKYVYHEFDSSVMVDAYEPFLSSIKEIFYNEYDMTIDEFLAACDVYEMHKPVLKSYF